MSKTKFAAGMDGQQHAEQFLTEKGYRIAERNYRVRTGEIDLIAYDGTYLVFIEVKTRTSARYGAGRESVTPSKQRVIIRTAQHYCTRHALHTHDMRFDVIEVLMTAGSVHIEHIENAFWA